MPEKKKNTESEATQSKGTVTQPQLTEKLHKMLANKVFFVESIKEMEKEVMSDDACSKNTYEEHYKCLVNYANKFDDICMKIHSESQFEQAKFEQFMSEKRETTKLCVKLKSILQEKIEACQSVTTEKPQSAQGVMQTATQSAQGVDQTATQSAQSVMQTATPSDQTVQAVQIEKKPAILFKGFKFSGIISEWLAFSKAFSLAIESTPDATTKDKLNALMDACTDMPRSLANTCGDDFNKAWAALNAVYGSTYKQCQAAIEKAINIKPCANVVYGELSQLLLEASNVANWLTDLEQLRNFDYALAIIIITKLPIQINRAWERERAALEKSAMELSPNSKFLPDWATVKNFLRNEVMLLASESVDPSTTASNQGQSSFADVLRTPVSSGPVSISSAQRFQNRIQSALRDEKKNQPIWLQCVLCDGIHPRFGCDIYNGWALDRKEFHVQEQHLCVRCLRQNHPGDCVDPKCNRPCPKCNDGTKHNSTLCPKQHPRQQSR